MIAFWAASEAAFAAWIVPVTIPGGKPTTAAPGLTPRSPLTTVGPVLVTVEAPEHGEAAGRAQRRGDGHGANRPSSPGARASVGPGSEAPAGVRCDERDSHPTLARATAAVRSDSVRQAASLMCSLRFQGGVKARAQRRPMDTLGNPSRPATGAV